VILSAAPAAALQAAPGEDARRFAGVND